MAEFRFSLNLRSSPAFCMCWKRVRDPIKNCLTLFNDCSMRLEAVMGYYLSLTAKLVEWVVPEFVVPLTFADSDAWAICISLVLCCLRFDLGVDVSRPSLAWGRLRPWRLSSHCFRADWSGLRVRYHYRLVGRDQSSQKLSDKNRDD